MIIGVGIDVVDIARFGATSNAPALRERLFTPEGVTCRCSPWPRGSPPRRPSPGLGAPGNMDWQDATVDRRRGERPIMVITGTVEAAGRPGWA